MKVDNKYSKFLFRLYSVEKLFMYIVFITGFFGSSLFTIDLKVFTLFPYRFFLVFLLCIFFLRALMKRKDIFHQERIKKYIFFLFFWLGYSIISLVWTLSKGDAIRNIVLLLTGIFLIFLSTYYFLGKRDMQNLFHLWSVIFGILIIIGFWEHLTGNHLPVSKFHNETIACIRFEPTGVFCNPNDYASFLALSIPFGLAIVRYGHKRFLRFYGLLSALGGFYFIVVTGSRANIAATFLELFFIFLLTTLSITKGNTNLNKKTQYLMITGMLVIFLCIIAGSGIQQLYGNIKGVSSSLVHQISMDQGSDSIRINLLKNGLSFLSSTFGFGVGAGNAEYYMKHFSQYSTAGLYNLHNWWLEILINYGIFVFFGYLLFYIGIMKNLWRIYQNQLSKSEKIICEALLVSLVGFFFASMSSSSIMAFNPQWLLFAFALSFINVFYSKKEIEEP